jgi:hypothetical protein
MRGVLRAGVPFRRAPRVAPAADTVSIAVAFVVTTPVNRGLMSRGKGHAVMHPYH